MNYFKLSEAELDMLLLNAFYPKKKERINFSDIDNFKYMILSLVQEFDLCDEFVESLLFFLKIEKKDFSLVNDKKKSSDKDKHPLAFYRHLFTIINIDIKFLKMSALKAFHDNKEYISV